MTSRSTGRFRNGAAFIAITASATLAGRPALAAADAESAYVLSTLFAIGSGILVMWMAAGFAMLEAGLVRSRSVASICLKNIGLFAIACLVYWLVGYGLMYQDLTAGLIGSPIPFAADDPRSVAAGDLSAGQAEAGKWFFQVVFVATAASIVSGTLAERVRLRAFFAFVLILTGLVYPIQGSWSWGGGWLAELGFIDFAGSTIVHSVGGWAALTGALFLGPRRGRYDATGRVRAMPGSNLPLATLGVFILWFGWFGFNAGSQLAYADVGDAAAIARIVVNTNMAAVGGVLAAMLLTAVQYKRTDLTVSLNGALAGLVSITADPVSPTIAAATAVGAAGGGLVVFLVPMLDRLGIDDVVGAIPVHLGAGLWGTLAVVLTNPDGSWLIQLVGIAAIGGFVAGASSLVWLGLKAATGLRLSNEDEFYGTDISELGLEAYPEFGRGSQSIAD